MAGFSSPLLVLVLALAAVGAMPLDTPEADVESPDILVLMPSSQTDAPAAATAPRMQGNDTEDAANLIPGAGDIKVLPAPPSQTADKDKTPEREDAPVTPIPPAAENTSAEAVNKPEPSSSSTEAAPSEAGPRPTQRVEEAPVTIMPAESVTTESVDEVEPVPARHTPRAEDVSADGVQRAGAGHPVSSTAPQPAKEVPSTAVPMAGEDTSASTVAPDGEEATTVLPAETEGAVTTPEAGQDVAATANPEDVDPSETTTPSVEDAVLTTTAPAAEDDTATTVAPVKEDVAEAHSEVGDPAPEADKQSAVFSTELPAQTTGMDAVANVVVDTVPSTAVPEVSEGLDAVAVTVVVENTDAMVTEAATTEETAPHRDVGEGRGRAFDHVLVAGADPSQDPAAQLVSTSQAPLPASEAAVLASSEAPSSEVPPPASEAPVSISEAPLPASEAPVSTSEAPLPASEVSLPASEAVVPASSEATLPFSEMPPPAREAAPPVSEAPASFSDGPLPVSEASLPASEEAAIHVSEGPLSSSEAPIPLTNVPDISATKQISEDLTTSAVQNSDHTDAAAPPAASSEATPVVYHPEETKPIGAPAPQVETAEPTDNELPSTPSTATSATGAARSVTRGGTARPINEGTEEAATKAADVEASAVIGKPTPASTGTARDVLIDSPDCPKMEADARFIVILVLLAALSVLGVSVVVLVMKFRVKPAARRTISMSMCWCLRWGRARRATITPPFAHNHHQRTEAQVGGTKANPRTGKGTEDYNLASDEDCRRGELAETHAQHTQQDMPTWTFYEKGVSAAGRAPAAAGPQSPSSPADRKQDKQEDEVLSSKM
ncbi:flocculation protein FLO11-like [Thrips palmi]|uniref:Flocculation protein FLO11-like n=1 Tax=Thrips palmi TaxID=161013 RepID=A0A6P8ZKI2_THRPL|nr:flocculation protein FLO11-like [Thrips palmi]